MTALNLLFGTAESRVWFQFQAGRAAPDRPGAAPTKDEGAPARFPCNAPPRVVFPVGASFKPFSLFGVSIDSSEVLGPFDASAAHRVLLLDA